MINAVSKHRGHLVSSLALASILLATLVSDAAEPWTLERALAQALTNSPDARMVWSRIQIARTELEQANAALWPRLQVQSSYTRTDNPMQVFGAVLNQRAYTAALDFNRVPDIDNLNLRALATLPLYSGGQIKAGRDAARAGSDAARADADAVRSALGFEVARAFHTVAKTRACVQAEAAAVGAFESNLAIATRRQEAGTRLKTDVLDLNVRLAQARENLVRTRNSHELAQHALRNLLGLEAGDFEVAEEAHLVAPPTTSEHGERPELVAARGRELEAEAGVRGARGGYYPRFSAFGSVDYNQGWRFNGEGTSWTAGALGQWDLWDGKLTRAKVNGARAKLEMAREEERKLKLAIDLEVEQARADLRAAAERLTVTRQTIDQAAESVALTRARFAQGLALASQLIDAEAALTAARVRRAEAEADQQIAVAALRKALGCPQLGPSNP